VLYNFKVLEEKYMQMECWMGWCGFHMNHMQMHFASLIQ